MVSPHPWWLFEQDATGFLFTDCQQQPHRVGLSQPVQHAHPPPQGVVPRISFTPRPATVGGLQVNTTHFTLQPGGKTDSETLLPSAGKNEYQCVVAVTKTDERKSDLTECKTM